MGMCAAFTQKPRRSWLSEKVADAVRTGNLSDMHKYIITFKWRVDDNFECGRNAVMWACIAGHLPLVKYLIDEAGADPRILAFHDTTILMEAATFGHLDIVKFLVEGKHVDVDATDMGQWTALIHAMSRNRIDIVKYLVRTARASTDFSIPWILPSPNSAVRWVLEYQRQQQCKIAFLLNDTDKTHALFGNTRLFDRNLIPLIFEFAFTPS